MITYVLATALAILMTVGGVVGIAMLIDRKSTRLNSSHRT